MTTNVRFVWNNVGDGTSSLTATSSAGTLLPANMQADERAAVWRSNTQELAAAPTVNAAGTGYVPVDVVTLLVTGSTSTVKGRVEVATTKVSATPGIVAAGTGGTPGAAVVTGTTGTGTKFTANVTISAGGAISSVDSLAGGGSYTVNPTNINNEPVTGGGLTGAALSVVMGVNTVTIYSRGTYTVTGTVATQDSTTGSGTGVTFTAVTFQVKEQTLTFQWAASQTVDSICLAWTNLTSTATVRCRGYTNTGGSGLLFDNTVSPDTGLSIGNTTVQNWIAASYAIKELQILIIDEANQDTYFQVSRAVIGARIEPVRNASQGSFSVGWREQTKPVRAESRDLRIEPGGRYRSLRLNLSLLEVASRDLIVAMVANGLGNGVWVSAFPEDGTASTRQLHAFWGALVQDVDFSYPLLDRWAAPLVFEEMG